MSAAYIDSILSVYYIINIIVHNKLSDRVGGRCYTNCPADVLLCNLRRFKELPLAISLSNLVLLGIVGTNKLSECCEI